MKLTLLSPVASSFRLAHDFPHSRPPTTAWPIVGERLNRSRVRQERGSGRAPRPAFLANAATASVSGREQAVIELREQRVHLFERRENAFCSRIDA